MWEVLGSSVQVVYCRTSEETLWVVCKYQNMQQLPNVTESKTDRQTHTHTVFFLRNTIKLEFTENIPQNTGCLKFYGIKLWVSPFVQNHFLFSVIFLINVQKRLPRQLPNEFINRSGSLLGLFRVLVYLPYRVYSQHSIWNYY